MTDEEYEQLRALGDKDYSEYLNDPDYVSFVTDVIGMPEGELGSMHQNYNNYFSTKVLQERTDEKLHPKKKKKEDTYDTLASLIEGPWHLKDIYDKRDQIAKELEANGENLTPMEAKLKDDLFKWNNRPKDAKKTSKRRAKKVESAIENNPNEVIQSDMPEPAKVEARQIVNDNDTRNDEANNNNVEAATKELPIRNVIPGSEPDPLGVNISNEERANWNGGKDRAVGDATLSEMDNALASRTRPVKPGTEMLDRAKPKGMLGAGMLYSRDENIPKPSEERPLDASNLEQITESNPEVVQEALPNTPIAEEARQITDDSDARNDEVNNQAAEETVSRLSDDFETVDDLYNYLETVNGMGWNNGRVDDVDLNGPDFPVDNNVYARDEDFVGPDEVVDYGLEDQNQYPTGIGNSDETVVQENVPEVNENDFVKSDVLPSADNVLELKPDEQEVVTEAIEKNVPEEEKYKYFGMLGFPHRKLGSFSPKSVNANNEQYKLDRLSRAGASSLGRIGGFSTGSGSITPGTVSTSISKPRAMTEHISSRAGGGNIPKSPNAAANAQVGSRAGNSNNGFVTSNGGNVSSGPVQKRSSLKSPKPTQLPNFTGHTGPIQTNQLGSAEDLHEALVERIKGMLDNLDPETRKKLGFSPTLYNYNGTPLDKLDGATLVQLSEMLESIVN
jgi:hypothetical protein